MTASTAPAARASRRLRSVLGWVIGTALVVIAVRSIDPRLAFGALARARPEWLVVAVVANATIVVMIAGLWRLLVPRAEPRVPFRRMLEIAAVSLAVMNTVPFLVGHATAIGLLVRRGGLTRAGSLAVLALDQLGEGISKLAIFLLVALAAPLPVWMRASIATVSLGVGALLAVLVVAAHGHERLHRLLTSWSREGGFFRSLVDFGGEWARALDALRSHRIAVEGVLYALALKAAEIAAIVAVQRSLGVTLGLGDTLLVMAAMMLATMIPLAPGNLGTYEASVFAAYRYLGVSAPTALALAVVQHVCFLIPSVGLGYAALSRRAVAAQLEEVRASASR